MVPKRKLNENKARRHVVTAAGNNKKKQKKKKGVFSRVLDEAWDVIEEIFD